MPVSQWVMLDCFLAWHSAQHWLSNRNTQYIRNMFEDRGAISRKRGIWYGVGVNRWPPKLHALSTGEVTFDTAWLKSQRSLWPHTVGQLCPSSVLVTVPCTFLQCPVTGGTTKKLGGHSKKMLRRNLCPPLLKCFRRQCSSPTPRTTQSAGCRTQAVGRLKAGLLSKEECQAGLAQRRSLDIVIACIAGSQRALSMHYFPPSLVCTWERPRIQLIHSLFVVGNCRI